MFELGWRSLRDLAVADTDELAQVVGNTELAESIIETANDAASGRLKLDVRAEASPPEVKE
jgi:N utilization substance protein A